VKNNTKIKSCPICDELIIEDMTHFYTGKIMNIGSFICPKLHYRLFTHGAMQDRVYSQIFCDEEGNIIDEHFDGSSVRFQQQLKFAIIKYRGLIAFI
jgi:hypothetical protein